MRKRGDNTGEGVVEQARVPVPVTWKRGTRKLVAGNRSGIIDGVGEGVNPGGTQGSHDKGGFGALANRCTFCPL